ncbi:MAG: AlkZ family DNA glycosylase [Anaerolineae bacterium]|nr:AlkZ family DNA glycosylase [Anaerolineae bacterium]
MAKAITAISYAELRRARLRSQLLAPGSQTVSAAETVSALFALQSQEWSSAQLAIHARCPAVSQADVIQAREVERAFILTWTLRGTLHLVAAEDVRWQLALCGPGAIRGTGSRYKRERGLEAIQAILSREGALIRSQLAQALDSRGIPVAGQAIHHLVRYAALRGLVCFGPEIDGDLSYVLQDQWLPEQAPQPNDPLPALARRYLAAYGPASMTDLKRWSGLATAQVKAAWKAVGNECVAVTLPDGEALMLKEQLGALETATDETTVRLLPRYDNYLLGYESRAFMVANAYAKRVHPGGGMIRACVLIDGEARANWKLEKRRRGLRVKVSPFERLSAAEAAQLEAEAEALGEFLNTSAELQIDGA